MKVKITPNAASISPEIRIPPSKSMAHRAIICASLADGISIIRNIDASDDILATIGAMRQIGAEIEEIPEGLKIQGISDFQNLKTSEVFCNESGSTLRFLIPVFSLTGRRILFQGKGRLMQRPQSVYEELYRQHGLLFEKTDEGLRTEGVLPSGVFELDGNVSSQFITGLLFALPLLRGDSRLIIREPFESRSYVCLTLQVLKMFGIMADFVSDHEIIIPGGQKYRPAEYTVEGDFSQLAFFAVLGAAGRSLKCSGMYKDSIQGDRAILSFLRDAGAVIRERENGYEFLRSQLKGTELSIADCPDLGPILMVMGLFAEGKTVIKDAGRLRMKESDRIAAMEEEIIKIGGMIRSEEGTIFLEGNRTYHDSVVLDGHNDHRVVMSMAVAAVCAGISVVISGAQSIRKSYPDFFEDLKKTGVIVEVLEA